MRPHQKRHYPQDETNTKALARRNRRIILLAMILIAALLVMQKRQNIKERIYHYSEQVNGSFIDISAALDRYRIDNGSFPLEEPGVYSAELLWPLTTPHPYLWDWNMTRDPFQDEPLRYVVLSRAPFRYVLVSMGPDKEWTLNRIPREATADRAVLKPVLDSFLYDPSNGIVSAGDMLHFGK